MGKPISGLPRNKEQFSIFQARTTLLMVCIYLPMSGCVEQKGNVPASSDNQRQSDVGASAANQPTVSELMHIHQVVVRLSGFQGSVHEDAMPEFQRFAADLQLWFLLQTRNKRTMSIRAS